MSDLYPTPTRLALLRAVESGWVWQHVPADETDLPAADWLHHEPTRTGRGLTVVTARCEEQKRAGWIEPPPVLNLGTHLQVESGRWRITESGRAVLAATSTEEADRA